MPTVAMAAALLCELAEQKFCGTLEIELHGGQVTEIHRTAASERVGAVQRIGPADRERRADSFEPR